MESEVQFERDRPRSPFATILERFVEVHPECLAALFLDGEGECIDYASQLPVFDALILGAQLVPLTWALNGASSARGGELVLWILEADERTFVIRRVVEELSVVLAVSAAGLSGYLLRAAAPLAEALRREAALPTPSWETWSEALTVELRPAAGWGYAPAAIVGSGGQREPVEVLGRWSEHGSISRQEVVCFRVRIAGQELTLSHERSLDRWQRR